MEPAGLTNVVFRIFRNGEVIALFPDEIADPSGNIMSYQHIGQHGAATYSHVISKTRLAKREEYQVLKSELERLGYSLRILTRARAAVMR